MQIHLISPFLLLNLFLFKGYIVFYFINTEISIYLIWPLFLKWKIIYCKKALSNLTKLVRLEEIKLILICTQENTIARNRILPVTKDMMLIINETYFRVQ